MLRFLLVCVGSVALSGANFVPDASYTFEDFCRKFSRDYKPGAEEYRRRKLIFDARLQEVLAHNKDASKTWRRGVNQFSDFSVEEFDASGRLGYSRNLARHMAGQKAPDVATNPFASKASAKLPASWDWRDKGVVSDVKDQGHCGSCWAFATAATIESHLAIARGIMEVLSPQQLVSCAPNPMHCGGTGGCSGSIPEVAFNYVQLMGGLTTEWRYPYTSYQGEASTCVSNRTLVKAVVEIGGYTKLTSNDYNAVMTALVEVGPLAINVQADMWSDYQSGVFTGCDNFSAVSINHVTVLVGYGSDPDLGDYWLVRNSWDATWGEKGYIRLKRNADPECGVDTQPGDGTGCDGGPTEQRVCGQCGLLFDVSYPVGVHLVQPITAVPTTSTTMDTTTTTTTTSTTTTTTTPTTTTTTTTTMETTTTTTTTETRTTTETTTTMITTTDTTTTTTTEAPTTTVNTTTSTQENIRPVIQV